ncbi:MAG: acyl-CoA dehydrogenase family protein [Acidobacteriota bacterium]
MNPKQPVANFWIADHALQRFISRRLPPVLLESAERQLIEMGEQAVKFFDPRAALADRHTPVLRNYDRYGNRVDEIDFHPAYLDMVERAYGAGLVALHYDEQMRTHYGYIPYTFSLTLCYLFAQAESGLFCPVCMTDGAARVLTKFADENLKRRFLPRLTARKRADLYQGAMFLTEQQGGSDVGANTTRAVRAERGWQLYGRKWFCSNAGAEVMLVLARPDGAHDGTRGLGLFLVPKWLDDGTRNNYRIDRLKDKLGVRSMPTGEVTFEGTFAYAVGNVERGFAYMAEMINLSRLYNAVASVAIMRRAVYEAVAHASTRSAFGRLVIEFPLMQRTLADLIVEQQAAFQILFEGVRLIDLIDNNQSDTTTERQLRLLTPLIKYYTARQAVWAASEAMEVLGGNGYIEEFVTARLLRDAQVLPIWEGTTNILTLDAVRAMTKEEAHEPLLAAIRERLNTPEAQALGTEVMAVGTGLETLLQRLRRLLEGRPEDIFAAREVTDELVRLVEASLLVAAADDEPARARARYFLAKHFGTGARPELANIIVASESAAIMQAE